MHFREWKISYFDWNITELWFQGSNWQWPRIVLVNGLALNRQQAITWPNADSIIKAALGEDELREGPVGLGWSAKPWPFWNQACNILEVLGPCLRQKHCSSTNCAFSVMQHYENYKHIFMFPKNKFSSTRADIVFLWHEDQIPWEPWPHYYPLFMWDMTNEGASPGRRPVLLQYSVEPL